MPHSKIHQETDGMKMQVFKLLPLNECNHLLASPDKENENRLSLIAYPGTSASLIVFQISIYVAKCEYGSSFGKP